MDRIDPTQVQGMTPSPAGLPARPPTQPPIRPPTRPAGTPHFATRAYASPASRQVATRDGTLARIGPDSFTPSVTPTTDQVAKPASHAPKTPANPASLVAARVPGGVDFTDSPARAPAPQTPAQTIPLYRHPADRNTVATAVHAGRILDVNG